MQQGFTYYVVIYSTFNLKHSKECLTLETILWKHIWDEIIIFQVWILGAWNMCHIHSIFTLGILWNTMPYSVTLIFHVRIPMPYAFSSNPYRHVNTSKYVAFHAVNRKLSKDKKNMHTLCFISQLHGESLLAIQNWREHSFFLFDMQIASYPELHF